MAGEILLLDGFDAYTQDSSSPVSSMWSRSASLVEGRFGGQAMFVIGNTNTGQRIYRFSQNYHSAVVMGAAIKLVQRPSAIFAVGRDGDTNHVSLGIDTAGRLQFKRGNWSNFPFDPTTFDVSGDDAEMMAIGEWNFVEFAVTCGPDGQQRVMAWVNGERTINAENITTYNVPGFDSFGIAGRTHGIHVDDFYVREGLVRLGEIRIETLPLTALTDQLGMSVHNAASVVEALDLGGSDGDTSYIYTNEVGAHAKMDIQDLVGDPTNIKAVQLRTFGRKEDVAYRSLRSFIESNGVVYEGRENVLSTAYTTHADIFERDPNGDVWWTPEGVNALKVGVKLDT